MKEGWGQRGLGKAKLRSDANDARKRDQCNASNFYRNQDQIEFDSTDPCESNCH